MKKPFQKLLRFLSVRLFLNIILWEIITYWVMESNIPNEPVYASRIYFFKFITIASLFIFTYVNNLYLVPRFLAKRRFGVYFPLAALLVIMYSVSYTVYIKAVIHYIPAIKLSEIIFLSVPINHSWTVGAVISGSIEYAITWAIWTFVLTMAWYMNDYSKQQKAMVIIQKKQVETELNFLKSQINPHFLFNTLNNLYALALKKSDIAPDAILKLSTILRYLLYESNTPLVSFDKEKEIMQAYIDLELLRLTETENLQFSISADKAYNLPPLLWLPILENVFKHGTRTISDNNYVEYMFAIKNNQLSIYARNNDKMLIKHTNETGGIGLTNMQKRLEILYPGKHSIMAKQEDNSYITEVKVELA